jgi:hypothetical protein
MQHGVTKTHRYKIKDWLCRSGSQSEHQRHRFRVSAGKAVSIMSAKYNIGRSLIDPWPDDKPAPKIENFIRTDDQASRTYSCKIRTVYACHGW